MNGGGSDLNCPAHTADKRITSRLKCDRGHPCDNCAKRNQSQSCQYANPAVRNRTAQARRVTYSGDIAERNQSADSAAIRVGVPDNDGRQEDLSARTLLQEIGTPGTMHGDQMGTRWFDDTHWQAIMDDVGACGGLFSAAKLIQSRY
ncbi:hypothetical protein N5P37_006443 [Trichoderma harzianum]|nr:hypothetical protein N5P37_006443 [Trichoderma harzianum]